MVERQFVALKVVGSSPTIHPLSGVSSLKKFKIKKKIFKKNTFLLKNIKLEGGISTKLLPLFFVLKKINFNNISERDFKKNFILCLSQKLYNTKTTIFCGKNLNTFSVGSIIKYFKVKQSKYIRRNLKGTKIFLNFLKNIFFKKYFYSCKNKNFFFKINGFDYNLHYYKKFYKTFYKNLTQNSMYFLINLKINFNKKKDKKIKAIKKRLKKKILLNFLKNMN